MALSRVAKPNRYMLSQVEAAVTEDVSLIAVPAKMPNGSPDTEENLNQFSIVGNKIATRNHKPKNFLFLSVKGSQEKPWKP